MLQYSDGTEIETTWNHPFYIEGRGWVEVKDLEVGDLSLTSGDTVLEITDIRMKPAPQTVYNIHLDKDHTYFVTDSDVLVHNYLIHVHEEITKIAWEKAMGEDASDALLAGVKHNDWPEGFDDFAIEFSKHYFSEFIHDLTGWDPGLGDKDSITYRTHFGDLQEEHAMARVEGEPAPVTQERVVNYVADLYMAAMEYRRNGEPEIAEFLIGKAMHAIQDSHASGHVIRKDWGKNAIVQFQVYPNQGPKHAEMDGPPNLVLDPPNLAPNFDRAVEGSRRLAFLFRAGVGNRDHLESYLKNEIFPLDPYWKRSGVAPGYGKTE